MVKRLSDWNTEKEDFQFIEHQLGVLDSKANNVLMLNSILIAISALGLMFKPDIDTLLKIVWTTATIFVLISACICLRTVWTTWASDKETLEEIELLRSSKTKFLHTSLIILGISLGLFSLAFIIGLILNS